MANSQYDLTCKKRPVVIKDVLDFMVGSDGDERQSSKSAAFVARTYRLARNIFAAEPLIKIPALMLLAIMAMISCKLNDLARLESQVALTLWSNLRNCKDASPIDQVRFG